MQNISRIVNIFYVSWLVLFWGTKCIASPGDGLEDYQDCIYQCERVICDRYPYHLIESLTSQEEEQDGEHHRYNSEWIFNSTPLPLHLRMLLWNCEQNCDYECQRIVTKERLSRKEEIYQFHGKWPFLRVFGIQEFASTIFSIGNLIVHLIGFHKIKRTQNTIRNYQVDVHLVTAGVTCLAWICSTIFHIRDFLITERMDYFLAGLTVLSGFHNVLSRYFKLYLEERRSARIIFTSLCVVAYASHIYRLVNDWSYTYNMRANITIGVLQDIFLILLCFKIYNSYYEREVDSKVISTNHLKYTKKSHILIPSFFLKSAKLFSLYPLLLSIIILMGMSLEILDFPPIFFDLIDAHSLWHLVTIIPVFYGWYDWIIWDIHENVNRDLDATVKST